MNRYIVVQDLVEVVGGSGGTGTNTYTRRLVVDLTTSRVMAHCRGDAATAAKVANALNALDGGPLS